MLFLFSDISKQQTAPEGGMYIVPSKSSKLFYVFVSLADMTELMEKNEAVQLTHTLRCFSF